eukprot:g19866.t1
MHAAELAGRGYADTVDYLLRAGADETIVDLEGRKASDVIGEDLEDEDALAEYVEHVRELLANAPANRAWRRRGYLVLCRAHPDRVQRSQVVDDAHRTKTSRRTRTNGRLSKEEGGAGGDTPLADDSSTGGDWAVAVAEVLLLQEDGIFRSIVRYL